ncbi:3-oxoacyl-[acyl-carrier protein] reductase [Pseudaminobacter salicylatoxidans]|uniref:3-oxoacyl-[acyl-carrier protein] reductase n=1 Tax=Pseudaminobacter salicylatoxidans TaxID=93369 RepID=A0A316C859_PSESE|nr:SDR family oxidoreductase [Pseudaminobacter salicylatoxidans]PWJ85965.1 3-oxoacyl-[acyl-carrier protein] reductase [Pseudaminobacter salicylatoxidans]
MDLGIRGKTAIVCASSRGLGKGCAMALAEAGCDLVVNGRDAQKLAETARELRERFGVKVIEVVGNVADPAVQKELLAAAPAPDILVNNNGGPPPRRLAELDREKILDGVTNNMITPIELVQAVIGGMAERGFGRIVNITSLSVYVPIPGLDVSSGARAGLTSFLAGVARTVADRNVTINNLLPGKLDTDRLRTTQGVRGKETPEEEAARKAKLSVDIPARRLGTPEEFGQICAFLCSVHAGYLTGQNIPVDGGLYVSAF